MRSMGLPVPRSKPITTLLGAPPPSSMVVIARAALLSSVSPSRMRPGVGEEKYAEDLGGHLGAF